MNRNKWNGEDRRLADSSEGLGRVHGGQTNHDCLPSPIFLTHSSAWYYIGSQCGRMRAREEKREKGKKGGRQKERKEGCFRGFGNLYCIFPTCKCHPSEPPTPQKGVHVQLVKFKEDRLYSSLYPSSVNILVVIMYHRM